MITVWPVVTVNLGLLRINVVRKNDVPPMTLKRQSHKTDASEELGTPQRDCQIGVVLSGPLVDLKRFSPSIPGSRSAVTFRLDCRFVRAGHSIALFENSRVRQTRRAATGQMIPNRVTGEQPVRNGHKRGGPLQVPTVGALARPKVNDGFGRNSETPALSCRPSAAVLVDQNRKTEPLAAEALNGHALLC